MKQLVFLVFLLSTFSVFAAQKAKIAEPEAEVYSAQDFDSEILEVVKQGEVYSISNNQFGAFYKIKLKSGKVGYIVDYVLDIEGKGRLKPKDMDQVEAETDSLAVKENPYLTENEEEETSLGRVYGGPSLQLINFHEDAFGSEQVDDLVAVGYKSVSLLSWSVLAAVAPPGYYAAKTGGSAKGGKLWADLGYSNTLGYLGKRTEIRFAGSFFTQVSLLQIETPVRKYDLHDITLGLAIEGGLLFKVKGHAIDLALKYYFDKSSYAGLGLSFLF